MNNNQITTIKPTPREFVKLWNQIHKALLVRVDENNQVLCPTIILSLEDNIDLMSKVDFVIGRLMTDADLAQQTENIRMRVIRQSRMLDVVIENKNEVRAMSLAC